MTSLEQAYDPERFREQGHQLVDLLADYLGQVSHHPVIPPHRANQLWHDWQQPAADRSPLPLFQRVLRDSIHLQHPRYMGHQINPPLPLAALSGLLVDVLNNGMGVFEMGMAGTVMERQVIQTTAQQFQFDERADGFLTSGGTLANLTALVAARRMQFLRGKWPLRGKRPATAGPQLAVMASQESHYCLERAAQIMGWGQAGVIKVPVNERFQLRTDLLKSYYDRATADGYHVVAAVGLACTTSTGSFDDLQAMGQFCREHDLWFHVDGAHGAALAFSDQHRGLLRGIHMADSVVLDFHKMLLAPAIISALIFRDGRHSYETFRQEAEYLWDDSGQTTADEQDWSNLARRTFECTKTMMSLKVFSILNTYGRELLDTYVSRAVELGAVFAQLIERRQGLELAVPPQCNIVCFRCVRPEFDESANNQLNRQVRQAIVASGRFYIVQTALNNRTWLRTTLANPFTTKQDLMALLDFVEETAGHIVRHE